MGLFPIPDPTADSVLAQAADMRAHGYSWKATARDLGRQPNELKQLAKAAGPQWRRLLAAARREMIEDAFAESVLELRRQVRNTLADKQAGFAAGTLVKLWMTLVRHRGRANKPPGPPPDPLGEYIDSLSDADVRKLLDEHRARQKPGPGNDPPAEGGGDLIPSTGPCGPTPPAPAHPSAAPVQGGEQGSAGTPSDAETGGDSDPLLPPCGGVGPACRAGRSGPGGTTGPSPAAGPVPPGRRDLPVRDRPARDVDVGVGQVQLVPPGRRPLPAQPLGDVVEGLWPVQQHEDLLDGLPGPQGLAIPGGHLPELHARRPLAPPVQQAPEVREHEVDPLRVRPPRAGPAGGQPAVELPEEPRVGQGPAADGDPGAPGLPEHPVGVADASHVAVADHRDALDRLDNRPDPAQADRPTEPLLAGPPVDGDRG